MRLKIKWSNGWAYVHGTAPDGKRIRRALKTQDARRAEEARAQLEARLWQSKLYGAQKVVTFGECAVAYAEDGGEVRFLVKITEQLGDTPLHEITPNRLRSAARAAYPTAVNATVNRQGITPARAVMNYGHDQGWCPMIKVKGFKVDKPVRQAVARNEIDAQREFLPDRLYALLLFLRQSGRRVGDAIKLTPADVQNGVVTIKKTKNQKPKVVRITPELIELLDTIEPRHGRVFGYVHRSSVYNTLRRAAAKAGMEYRGTHQIGRHSFASELLENGWNESAIAEAGGWASTRMVSDIYAHPVDSSDRATEHFSNTENGKLLSKRTTGGKNGS